MILSHTWEDEEITYEEHEAWLKLRAGDSSVAEPDKAGFRKIKEFCRVCREDYSQVAFEAAELGDIEPGDFEPGELQWAWIDTCCIDKRSSAELSEAINSMYSWYKNAMCCIAFLSDVESGIGSELTPFDCLAHSRWFTRGWTLQELIAPEKVQFYDVQWVLCGSRGSYAQEIAALTSIPEAILNSHCLILGHPHIVYQIQEEPLNSIPVATKLSWAANRKTTRIEDRAYSLLGLLNINMPLLYGEGAKAFHRLQEVFIKQSVDHSLLVWNRQGPFSDIGGAGSMTLDRFARSRFPDMTIGSMLCKGAELSDLTRVLAN
jgi:hypothetical protein